MMDCYILLVRQHDEFVLLWPCSALGTESYSRARCIEFEYCLSTYFRGLFFFSLPLIQEGQLSVTG